MTQAAPNARILSLHVMDGSGFFPQDRVADALRWLVDRVAGSGNEPESFVDVVCLAFGYYEDDPMKDPDTTELRALLGELGDRGVLVVVAAGNDRSTAPTFPAAFTGLSEPDSLPRTPLLSVGAVHPDGSRADYSNSGEWVGTWAPGTALISTVPESFGEAASSTEPAPYDPNNLLGGFARWSGTSFAAAVVAGRVAAQLSRADDLHDVAQESAAERVASAVATVLGTPPDESRLEARTRPRTGGPRAPPCWPAASSVPRRATPRRWMTSSAS